MGNCTCILCYVGKKFNNDIIESEILFKALEEYDINLSPHTITRENIQDMINWLKENNKSKTIHFTELEEYFWVKEEKRRKELLIQNLVNESDNSSAKR